MLSKSMRVAMCLLVISSLSMSFSKTNARNRDLIRRLIFQFVPDKPASPSSIIYSQPPSLNGGLIPTSRWDPDGSDYDQWVWDSFSLMVTGVITGVQWRGGFDPTFFGSGGPVIDFVIDIYPSIQGGSQPDVANPPLVEYHIGGNAGETPAGSFGGIAMYDYKFVLPASFQASAGTKYWVEIVALQHGIPDWGITKSTGGDGYYFRKIHSPTPGYIYQTMQGNSAFALLGPPLVIYSMHIPLVNK